MCCDPHQSDTSPSRGYRGPHGLGDDAARALAQGAGAGQGIGAVADESILKRWSEETGCLIPNQVWDEYRPITNHTSEHEVRYRTHDHRAIKRTWPGMFGFIPRKVDGKWMPQAATPREYLCRQALQNDIFGDSIRLEGIMISSGPSMLIGQPPGGLSIVISQPWLDAADDRKPHPTDEQIASHLAERGFEPLFGTLFGWMNPDYGYVVLDAKADNFILTPRGVLPIDLLITECQAVA
jgi:hypothetical protein